MSVCDNVARRDRIAGCANLESRHEPSGRNSTFPYDERLPFPEYVAKMRSLVQKARRDASYLADERSVDANSPFEWRPDPQSTVAGARGGVLLVHGLTDSPFLMQDVGRHFQSRGYVARAIVLPGHGTVPGDLLDVEYEEWLKAVRYGIRSFGDQVRPVLVGGFSTGAAAALHTQMEDEPNHAADGLILLSPALKPRSELSFMANWHKIRGLFKTPEEYAPKRWLEVATDEDYAKYESFTKNAGDQIHLLSKKVRGMGADTVRIPVFMAVSTDDDTVSAESTIEFFADGRHNDSRLLLYTNEGARGSDDGRTIRRRSAYPNHRVLDFSHTAIPISPDNPHYGEHGDYRNCMHYIGDPELWKQCKDGAGNVMLGEKSDENLNKYTIQRLTFNPDFLGMLETIDRFVDSVESAVESIR